MATGPKTIRNRFSSVTRSILTLSLLLLIGLACRRTTPPTQPNSPKPPVASPSPTVALPHISGPVNDLAEVLDDAAEKRITERLAVMKKDRHVEMAILTVPSVGSQDMFTYSLAVAQSWTSETEQRVLLVMAMSGKRWHIQVTDSLASALTNNFLKEVGEASESNYKHGEYEAGIVRLISGIEAKLRKQQ